MKPPRLAALMKDLLIPNAIILGLWILALQVLNFLSEGKLAMLSGALMGQGWDPEDVGPVVSAILALCLLLFDLAVFALFYLFSYLRLRKNDTLHTSLLAYLGTRPFDREACRRHYLTTYGRRSILFYGTAMLIFGLCEGLAIPFVSMLVTPQALPITSILSMCGATEALRRVLEAICIPLINIVAYAAYQAWVIPRVLEKWAGERLRVET